MELSDNQWLFDEAFLVDMIEQLSELNIELQGLNQLLGFLLSCVKTCEGGG